ncbi:acyl-CoA N-acyltransferase [Fusarium flagelliforme]|uniref:Acetyltransferase (Gnat) family domain-containing protein n=1 Tax=Fusarium flagelliforme TaxID=2675880 RepID=A0A395MCE5_9HYPO|nr:acyl-CoA N-acyltransferase [Fusarium flagelliforme]KAH7173427.1 acyl-CoA N-acyltransferase [Fusarium flagelliforme]RFN45587.1 acetyltransferase (gnat) family domain-containing protein [Fusarium flagelliforme]
MYQVQSPCRVEDGKYIAQSKVAAFWDEAWWRLSWTGRTKEYVLRGITDRSPKNLLTDREVRRHQKAVHNETGDIVGYARWIMPESHKDSWLIAQTPDVSDEEREMFTKRHSEAEFEPRTDNDKLDDHMGGWREKYKHANCMELHYIGVRPDHQHQGLASMLVKSGLEAADQLGIDVLVVATGRRGQKLYSKHGFEILEEKSQSMAKFGVDELYETFVMIRRAKQ